MSDQNDELAKAVEEVKTIYDQSSLHMTTEEAMNSIVERHHLPHGDLTEALYQNGYILSWTPSHLVKLSHNLPMTAESQLGSTPSTELSTEPKVHIEPQAFSNTSSGQLASLNIVDREQRVLGSREEILPAERKRLMAQLGKLGPYKEEEIQSGGQLRNRMEVNLR
jgi:hypothetical protein